MGDCNREVAQKCKSVCLDALGPFIMVIMKRKPDDFAVHLNCFSVTQLPDN